MSENAVEANVDSYDKITADLTHVMEQQVELVRMLMRISERLDQAQADQA